MHHVSGLGKQNINPQYLDVKKPLKMANDIKGKELTARSITAKLPYNYAIFRLKENSQQETK